MTTGALLQARGVAYAYPRTRSRVITDVDLEVERGQTLAVVGPSGSGKSTLLYLLGLMVRPHAGSVLVEGARVDDRPDRERAARRAHDFGFVFQDAVLDPHRTVLDNVLETALYRSDPPRDARRRALALLDQFGVAARAAGRPGQISGGQAQRIALCRALLGRPRIVLADEPTGNLDPASADVVVEALTAHARAGGCVVVVTHDETVAAQCDAQVRL